MPLPTQVRCPTCSAEIGEHCVVVRRSHHHPVEVVVHPVRHLAGSPHMARRKKAALEPAREGVGDQQGSRLRRVK
jgi:hypothetical protein